MTKKEENRHSATNKEQCKKMAKLNKWKLIRIEETGIQNTKSRLYF